MHAQSTFEKIYFSTGSYMENLIQLNSQNLLTGLAWYPGVSLLDANGNFIQSKCFYGDSVLVMGSVRQKSANEFYFTTIYVKDSCSAVGSTTVPFTRPAIGKMDSLGSILEVHHYALNSDCVNPAGDLLITQDHGAITWGRQDRFFALRVDSNLAPVWARRFNNIGQFQFIKELQGGDLLAGFTMDTAGAAVARLDANGNFIWCKSYMRPLGRMHDALIESDSSFIITGYTITEAGGHVRLFMMKLDGAGAVQWCKGYDSGALEWDVFRPSRIERTLDGRTIVLATLGGTAWPWFYRPFLMKTDLNGDTLWTRSTGADGYIYYTRDLLVSSDGGFLFSGIVWGDLPDGNSGLPYIFKTDSLGHFSCLERHHPITVLDLFPTDSSFTLTSVDGATMMPAFVNDTVFDPLTVYDACIVTSMPKPIEFRRSKIRPNPTTGRITVEFDDPLERDSFYSVYDELGRLLYQRPLPPGREKEEIDLSRFGNGAYVLRFTLPDSVRHERVVVE